MGIGGRDNFTFNIIGDCCLAKSDSCVVALGAIDNILQQSSGIADTQNLDSRSHGIQRAGMTDLLCTESASDLCNHIVARHPAGFIYKQEAIHVLRLFTQKFCKDRHRQLALHLRATLRVLHLPHEQKTSDHSSRLQTLANHQRRTQSLG